MIAPGVSMLRPFLRHHLGRAHYGKITNVILHCHAPNLASVMLHDEPGNQVRMFYANALHNLHLNLGTSRMSVAIHSHRFDTTLVPVFGRVYDLRYEPQDDGIEFEACRYESGVTGTPLLEPMGTRRRLRLDLRDHVLPPGGHAMRAETMHTVGVERYCAAAWLVFEGEPAEHYDSTCYTNNPHFDPTGLYVRDSTAAESLIDRVLAEVPR